MLIGYEGGVVAWDFQKNAVVKTFEMILPPGAPGGGSYEDADGVRLAIMSSDRGLTESVSMDGANALCQLHCLAAGRIGLCGRPLGWLHDLLGV